MDRTEPCERRADTDEAHLRCAALLRRWLIETHTPVTTGALWLVIGPIRLHTEVLRWSPTGAHEFGPIQLVGSTGRPTMPADPGVLAAACSKAARQRARPDAPINRCFGSLVDWLLHSLRTEEHDPAPVAADLAGVASSISDQSEAERWLRAHLETDLLPEVRGLDPTRHSIESATATLLTRRAIAVIGILGRRCVVDEAELLGMLSSQLATSLDAHPDAAWLLRYWLTSPTLTDHAAVNGSGLCYTADTGALEATSVPFERPNPLIEKAADVPSVPIPALGRDWTLRPVEIDMEADVTLVHRWMNTEHVARHWNQAWTWRRWREELTRQLSGDHSVPCLVARHGRALAYVELYRVLRDGLASCYPYHAHDLGVHIAVGEPDATGRGAGSTLLRVLAEGLLAADPDCVRVVAEPNVHNPASIAAFGKAGFARTREVALPAKNSALMIFDR